MAISALDKVGVIRLWAKSKALIPSAMAAADATAIAGGSSPSGTDGYLTLKGLASYDAEITKATPTQADWEDENTASLAYIRNKPSLPELPIDELKSLFAYGIQYDITVSDPALTRIGNMELHKTLPIQSKMRGCLLNDAGEVVSYLNSNNWTQEIRDGSEGMVMVELPEHYRKFEKEGDVARIWISEYPIEGFTRIPKVYVGAYEAAADRDNSSMLASVVNNTARYRGGRNSEAQQAWDGTYRTQLGRPCAYAAVGTFRSRASARGSGWTMFYYDAYKTVVYLYMVEYANRNVQLAFNAQLTEEGYHQGGLGYGVKISSTNWNTYNTRYPFVPCGLTDSYGNGSCALLWDIPGDNDTVFATVSIPRYRGIEHLYGHFEKTIDGIASRIESDGKRHVYVQHNPKQFKTTIDNTFEHIGISGDNGYISKMLDDELIPAYGGSGVSGSASTYYCDYYAGVAYDNLQDNKCEVGGGCYSTYQDYNGLFRLYFNVVASTGRIGTRIAFTPWARGEDWTDRCLTFEPLEDAQFSFTKRGTGDDIQYSIDYSKWVSLPSGELTPVVKKGSSIRWRGEIKPRMETAASANGMGVFASTGKYDAKGNPMSIRYKNFFNLSSPGGYALAHLFLEDENLVNAKDISLGWENAAVYCCFKMFCGCSSLISTPETPAQNLANGCYREMYMNCTSLVSARPLPATTLAERCYFGMYYGCVSLEIAPDLFVSMMSIYSYYRMFSGCGNLKYIKCLATDISADYCVSEWLKNVSATGTFVKASTMSDWPTGHSGIPSGWTVVDYVES